MPTPYFLQNALHQIPIFSKCAADLKLDQFEVEDLYILLGWMDQTWSKYPREKCYL